jgi:drug/metabolite transporter (DMT)-like permease
MFFVMLISSLAALKHVSVSSLVVIRNVTTIVVAIADIAILRNPLSIFAINSLFSLLGGVLLFAKHDLSFSFVGYIWLAVNCVFTAAYQIYVKQLVEEFRLDAFVMALYNNVLSMPLCVAAILLSGEADGLSHLWSLTASRQALVGLSTILGFILSASAFRLNQLISATSQMVINNVNKFIVVVAAEIFLVPVLTPLSWTGTIIVFLSGYMYAHENSKASNKTRSVQAAKWLFLCLCYLTTFCLFFGEDLGFQMQTQLYHVVGIASNHTRT